MIIQTKLSKKYLNRFFSRYQIGLETSTRCSDFIFHGVTLIYFRFRKINFKRGGSYIESLDWIKKQ